MKELDKAKYMIELNELDKWKIISAFLGTLSALRSASIIDDKFIKDCVEEAKKIKN